GAHPRRLDHVHRVPAARDQYFGREVVVVVDLHDLANQLHAIGRHVVETADERTDVARANFRGEERLRRRETERHVDADAFARERLARFDAVTSERYFHDHVLVDL